MPILTIVYWNHGHSHKEATTLGIVDEDPGLPEILKLHSLEDDHPSVSIIELLDSQGLTLREARKLLPTAELWYKSGTEKDEEIPAEILDGRGWHQHHFCQQSISKSGKDLQPLADFLRMPIVGYARFRESDRLPPTQWFSINPS
jgi:hypothetical protein